MVMGIDQWYFKSVFKTPGHSRGQSVGNNKTYYGGNANWKGCVLSVGLKILNFLDDLTARRRVFQIFGAEIEKFS